MTSSQVPIVRQASWTASIPQLVALAIAMGLGVYVLQSEHGVALGAGLFLLYTLAVRRLVARSHRRGIRFTKRGQFADAIVAFQQSYDFFTRHAWVDDYRAIVLMSPSRISYREMALLNIAFSYSQLAEGKQAEACYERVLAEFPNSGMATVALNMIRSLKPAPAKAGNV